MVAAEEWVGLMLLAAVAAYAVLGGADFGAGILQLAPLRRTVPGRDDAAAYRHRALRHAIGPVWEANHVWLIFALVIFFTAFPRAFGWFTVRLFVPLHLALLGIVLRGAAYAVGGPAMDARPERPAGRAWRLLFGGASTLAPVALGVTMAAVTGPAASQAGGWVFRAMTGLLAAVAAAHLAAVFVLAELPVPLRPRVRHIARVTQVLLVAAGIAALAAARWGAPRISAHLGQPATAAPFWAAFLLAAALTAALLWRRHDGLARFGAAGEVLVLLAGWASAQWPYLAAPDWTLFNSAAPDPTLAVVLQVVPIGLALLLPALGLLMAVFKGPMPGRL